MKPLFLHKSFVYFLLGIGIPSIIMGYLAFRGIKNDHALLEKKRAAQYSAFAEEIEDAVNRHLRQMESSFLERLSLLKNKNRLNLDHLDKIVNDTTLVLTCFTFRNNTITFPSRKLLFYSSTANDIISSIFEQETDAVKNAAKYEFQKKNYPKAIELYKKALRLSSAEEEQARILSCIARAYRKMNNNSAAVRFYRQLRKKFYTTSLSSGLPTGAIAGLKIADIFMEQGNWAEAVKLILNTYENLLKSVWQLDEARYGFLLNEIKSRLSLLHQNGAGNSFYSSKTDSLLEKERWKTEQTRRFLDFQSRGKLHIREYLISNRYDKNNPLHQIAIKNPQDQPYLVLLARVDSSPIFWGLLLNDRFFQQKLFQAVEDSLAAEDPIPWTVKGRNNEPVFSSKKFVEAGSVFKSFRLDFPPVIVELQERPEQITSFLFFSSSRIYLYIFIFIAVIFIFGFVLTFSAINHELTLTKMKSNLASVVSHDFKNPLTSMRQLAEMLYLGRVPGKQRQKTYYQVIMEQCDRLKFMIDNVLDFSRLGKKGVFNFQLTNISQFMYGLITSAQQNLTYKGFDITANISTDLPFIRIDPLAMEQAVTNLLDNAVKFSGDKKIIELNVYRNEYNLFIEVKDYGSGMAPDEQAHIFKAFYRGKTSAKNVHGSGLGLTIVKQIVEAHQGQIEVNSVPGAGSSFMIKLPLGIPQNRSGRLWQKKKS
ncbi:MAG TPA: GHKL domain-containing protein [Caldithrix abyssi]|uniref:histidine kinase n=1 Tax=Caldithrix abyssi TaxID=187145 RepID=A0A7V4U3G7_CALAY|nr:GHKL domain-containing protein [Caldithrix abyssi]